jgi:hypothetical protein
MLNVIIDRPLTCHIDTNYPQYLSSKLTKLHHDKCMIPLRSFIEKLPFIFEDYKLTKPLLHLRGYQQQDTFALITNPALHPQELFHKTSYFNWSTLESDIQLIDKNATLQKKSSHRLDQASFYLKPIVAKRKLHEIASLLGTLDDIISIDEFKRYFYCCDSKEAQYIISYYDIAKIPALSSFIGDKIEAFPMYLFSQGNHKSACFYVVEGVAYFLHKDNNDQVIHVSNPIAHTDSILALFDACFDPTKELRVENITDVNLYFNIPTSTSFIHQQPAIPHTPLTVRKWANEHYKIKGMGKEAIWEKTIKKLNEPTFNLDAPLFFDMGNQSVLSTEYTHNQAFIQLLKETPEELRVDTYIRLNTLAQGFGIDTDSPIEAHIGKGLQNQKRSYFMMPDYKTCAKTVPNIQDIYQTKKDL